MVNFFLKENSKLVSINLSSINFGRIYTLCFFLNGNYFFILPNSIKINFELTIKSGPLLRSMERTWTKFGYLEV